VGLSNLIFAFASLEIACSKPGEHSRLPCMLQIARGFGYLEVPTVPSGQIRLISDRIEGTVSLTTIKSMPLLHCLQTF
jgi:hypothetical protein